MIPLIRTWLIWSALVFFYTSTYASGKDPRPFAATKLYSMSAIRKADSIAAISLPASSPVLRVCSCQILNLREHGQWKEHVAVFAEKNLTGNLTSTTQATQRAIEREKRHMKELFYDRVKLVKTVSASTDCKTMYVRLRTTEQGLVFYDIVDANIK